MRERQLFTLGLAVFAGIVLYETFGLGATARRVPLVVALPVFAMFTVQFFRDLAVGGIEEGETSKVSHPFSRETYLFAGLLFLGGAGFLFGLSAAIPAYLFLHLRFLSRERWLPTAVLTLGTWASVHLIFSLGLGVRLHEGLIWRWLLN
jgi:hypothetical protein